MNSTEFYYWFKGFVQGMDGLPNEKDWSLILSQLIKTQNTVEQKVLLTSQYVPFKAML